MGSLVFIAFLFLTSCSPVTLTSWKNPKVDEQVGKIMVWGMFNKLEYEKPFEDAMSNYFTSKGLKAIPALSILNPNVKYEYTDMERIVDSIGADGILIFVYQGSDKEENYVPPTTTVYPDYYYNYYGYYNWYYPNYAPGYNVVSTGGYWTTTTIVNLQANLYGNRKDELIWTGQISITDPEYIDAAAVDIGKNIFQDLSKNGILKVQ
jgi:hypothetical protein